MTEEIVLYLRDHPMFRELTEDQQIQACTGASIINIKKNSHLFEQGDKAGYFYYLIKGQIKLSRISRKGDEKIIELLHTGQTFGEALMFLSHSHYPVCGEALQNSKLIRIPFDNYHAVLSQSVDSCMAVLGELSIRMHELIDDIERLTLHNASCRLSTYLASVVSEESDVFILDVPKVALASRLSISPETFSRILNQLCKLDLIRIERNEITIINREGLKAFSDDCVEFTNNASIPRLVSLK